MEDDGLAELYGALMQTAPGGFSRENLPSFMSALGDARNEGRHAALLKQLGWLYNALCVEQADALKLLMRKQGQGSVGLLLAQFAAVSSPSKTGSARYSDIRLLSDCVQCDVRGSIKVGTHPMTLLGSYP